MVHVHTCTLYVYMRISENHNSLGCKQPSRPRCKTITQRTFICMHDCTESSCRCLELHYPYFPNEADFTHSVLSSGDIVRDNIALLLRFSLQWRRLQAGGELLPDLVELYQWLHTDLAHVVSYETACKVKIKSVIDRAVRRYSPDMGLHLQQLFAKVKGEHVCVTGAEWTWSAHNRYICTTYICTYYTLYYCSYACMYMYVRVHTCVHTNEKQLYTRVCTCMYIHNSILLRVYSAYECT